MYAYARPGTGVASERCGQYLGREYCEDGHEYHDVVSHCDKWECPVCYDRVAARAARRIEAQWKGKVEAYRRAWGVMPAPSHYTWSRDADQVFDQARHLSSDWPSKYRAAAVRAMRRFSVGLFGGVVVVHPWRKRHDDGSTCESRLCREHHVWVWGPHVHLIGWGHFVNSLLVRRGGRGWLYHRIDDVGERNVYSTAHYQLTHGAIVEGQNAYAWVGLMSPASVVLVRRERVLTARLCTHCGKPLYRDRCDRESGEVVPMQVYEITYIYHYKTRKKRPFVRKNPQKTLGRFR